MIILFKKGEKKMKKPDGVAEAVKLLLEKVPGIQYAFIYGPFVKNPGNPESDVDVMVIGGPDLVEMDEIISKTEEVLKRAIRITSFTVREFKERIKVNEDLVFKALKGPKIMLIGHEREMIKI
jgi:predicted nucleotidyltransferase